MDVEKVLTERFSKACRDILDPCPLLGPKWFRYYAKGKPADFVFAGVPKLAKATGKHPKGIAQALLRRLDLKGLDARTQLTADYMVFVRVKGHPGETA